MSTTPVLRRWDQKKKAYVHSLRPLAFYFCPAESTVDYSHLLESLTVLQRSRVRCVVSTPFRCGVPHAI